MRRVVLIVVVLVGAAAGIAYAIGRDARRGIDNPGGWPTGRVPEWAAR